MMKKTISLSLVGLLYAAMASAHLTIDGTIYQVDTLVHHQVGPGVVNTIVRLPQYPLNVYILETDLTNPHNRVESTIGYNTVGRTERLVDAVVRNRTATRRPIAACNANFWVVTGNGAPLNIYALGSPQGGVVRNDTTMVNTNMTCDQWNGGYTRTGVAAISHDKTLYLGHMAWAGHIASARLGQDMLPFHNVNRRAVAGEIALWGPAYGRTREFEDDWTAYNTRGDNASDNYYLTLAEGSGWTVGGEMTVTIGEIVPDADRQTLGDYDACLTVTGEQNKALMASHQVGDTLRLASGWTVSESDRPATVPHIENLVEGNATIMHNGELLDRNYDEEYNSRVYSRTCYGSSADGKHLYMIVIDRATSPLYGTSAGCPTAVACQILKQLCPLVTEMVNMDAGGSAEMLVGGEIINTTTEGTPRAVACGWMIEAVGEEDSTVASIQFDSHRLTMPIYSSVVPRVLGFNQAGELVNDNVHGFTLTCDPTLGTAVDSLFTAGGQVTAGTLTASYRDMTATVPVTTLAAQPAIALRPIVIDSRDYPVEVTAVVGNEVYAYTPSLLMWQVDDPQVSTVTDGVLRGVSNGTTRLTCSVGDWHDEDTVVVEISSTPYRYQPWNGWTLKGSGASAITLNDTTGVVNYTYSGGRAPYLQLSKDVTFFGLPDSITLAFTSSIPVDYMQLDVRNRTFTSSNYMKINPDSGFAAGVAHEVMIDLAALGGTDRVATYPVTLKNIKLVLNKSADMGEQQLTLHYLRAYYSRVGGMNGDVNGDGLVTIADANAVVAVLLGTAADASMEGRADVNGDGIVNIADACAVTAIVLEPR